MKLFVDSSNRYLYINILDNDKILSYTRLGKNDHSEMMVSSLEDFLANNNYTVNDIEEIYIGKGPGSYTGVRISATFGKTLAYIKNLPLYSFSSLDYLLLPYLNKDGFYIAKIDAKKNHSYVKAVRIINNKIEVVLPETFSENTIFEKYQDAMIVCADEIEKDVRLLLSHKLVKEEDKFEFSPNYLRSEFN